MMLWILLPITGLLITLIIAGAHRVSLPRKEGFEGIESPDTAEAYTRFNRWPQFEVLRTLVLKKTAGYKPAGMIIDIGCGPGLLTIRLAGRFKEHMIIGVDTSEEMVRNAARNAEADGAGDHVAFTSGDVIKLPFPDNSVGFAVSTLSFHHWGHPEDGLKELYRVLRPGGQLLIFDLRRDSRRAVLWLLKFVRIVIVPKPIKKINEPVGSLYASYTEDELQDFISRSPFPEWNFDGGAGFYFLQAEKLLTSPLRRS